MRISLPRAILGVLTIVAVLSCLACRDADESATDTTGTALYVFDASSSPANRILVWDNVDTLNTTPTTAPTRKLSDSRLNNMKDLAWGGMCLDRSNNRLFLVSETGKVARVERINKQDGTISTSEIVSFQLGSSDQDRLSSGKFGQTSIDSAKNILYVTEFNASETRIWVVSNPTQYAENSSVSPVTIKGIGDKDGWGVAVGGSSEVFTYANSGDTITVTPTTYTGSRLRKGTNAGFQADSNVIIGIDENNNKTLLGQYGALAFDTSNNILYVARHNTDSSKTGKPPVLAFTTGQFSPGLNIDPSRTRGSTTGMDNLRILAHAGNKDWLVGATAADGGGNGSNRLWIWKTPSTGDTYNSIDLDSTVVIKGLALDGSN